MSSPVERVVRRLHNAERQARHANTVPRLPYSSVDDGAIELRDAEGNTAGYVGTQFDGTVTSSAVGGTWPSITSPPLVTPIPGGLRLYWDGTYADGSITRMDFKRITFHAVTDVNAVDPLDSAQIVGEITIATGGEVTVSLPEVEHFIFVVAWTDSGKFSEPSEPGWGTPLALLDGAALDDINAQIEDINNGLADAPTVYRLPDEPTVPAGKKAIWFDTDNGNVPNFFDGSTWTQLPIGAGALAVEAVVGSTIATGALDGKKITGALIQTVDVLDSGIKLVGDDFVAYDAAGDPTLHVDGTTGDITLAGALMAGGRIEGSEIVGALLKTENAGRRIEINSPGYDNRIALFTGSGFEDLPGLVQSTAVSGTEESTVFSGPVLTPGGSAPGVGLRAKTNGESSALVNAATKIELSQFSSLSASALVLESGNVKALGGSSVSTEIFSGFSGMADPQGVDIVGGTGSQRWSAKVGSAGVDIARNDLGSNGPGINIDSSRVLILGGGGKLQIGGHGWNTYTAGQGFAVTSSGSGTALSHTSSFRYKRLASDTLQYSCEIEVTNLNGGTGDGVRFTFPFTLRTGSGTYYIGDGRESLATGKHFLAFIVSSTQGQLLYSDNSSTLIVGRRYGFAGTVELA